MMMRQYIVYKNTWLEGSE